ncbi:hypothetical protein PHYSODRAFT_493999 [Phytophthora sojae]|uniref:C3H1-type domain-containing protein n=1 Tax=Phytophthora sojae (strain P6497) TaxID=1094619 RepID=G4Z5I5_PHYSP|nr:hypothetical protein PHYSODRAFT_493999 [Phytophthora sojae]EGZ21663.1 hypothetical protein PHYSODRAFT_493999 [Phytophthora sojae]|eukprot:XP_009524380.1 hypothetical protein PHYSODRAFT_493999 [Phytophthora sojae]
MYTPPTDTVIAFRNAASLIPFDVSNATATGLYGVRIGSQGLSIRHFTPLSANERLVRSSSNANFSIDFSSVTAPAEPPTTCPSYDVILLALSGLSAFGSAFWYPHMISLLDRLRRFVTDNQAADPNNFPDRVTLTLQYANVYLGRAAGHLAMDTPTWWCDFRAATAAIEYKSLEWLPAFQSLPTTGSANLASQSVPAPPRRPSSTRPPTMLGHLRQQIPRRSDGPEPCLRFFGGDMCFGGSRDKCAYSHRTHRWDSPLPRELQAYINRQYGSNRRGHYGPRRN